MDSGKLVGIVFFVLCSVMALAGIIKPDFFVSLTKKWYRWLIGFLGYEVDIKPIPGKAQRIIRLWFSICLVAYMLMIMFIIFS